MKKQLVGVTLVMAALTTVLASCSIGGGPSEPQQTQQPVRSYSEKASYYDALVAGDSDPIPLTTALNSSVSIEGDSNLLEEEVYNKIVEIANQTFPLIRDKYAGGSSMTVTIILDASSVSYSPCYAAGRTVLLNTEWLNNHPKDCDILIDGFSSIVLSYSHEEQIPQWLLAGMRVYVRDEFALYRSESSFQLPKRYNGKSYEKDSTSAAAFLKWIKTSQNVDIVDRLNRQMRSAQGYQETIWKDSTDKTLDQLFGEFLCWRSSHAVV